MKLPPTSPPGDPHLPRLPMVDWYDPRQLAQTALRAVLSATFGAYADRRELQAALAEPDACHLFDGQEEVWIDYTADLGSGWNATYSLAHTLAQPTLTVDGHPTRRGDLLVMGGDQVYPTATADAYQQRLINPYHAALSATDGPPPALFAVPGNHDWYDGLAAFLKVFCQQRRLGGWQTHQARSYFAVPLPHRWWLWGIDIQLNADVDKPQLDYFRQVAAALDPADRSRVILCTAEPAWVYRAQQVQTRGYDNLEYFCNACLGPGIRPRVVLTGDLHHYASYRGEGPPAYWKITAGGGGAFTHPTHQLPAALALPEVHSAGQEAPPPRRYHLHGCAPGRAESRRMAWRNLAFPFINWRFTLSLSLFCLLFAWGLATAPGSLRFEAQLARVIQRTPLGELADAHEVLTVLSIYGRALVRSPLPFLLLMALMGGTLLFSDRRRGGWAAPGAGVVHALLQGAALLFSTWLVQYATHVTGPWPPAAQMLLFVGGLGAVGGLLGSFLFGLYLLFCTLVLGTHDTEAFSSFRDQDHKCFLRLHLTADALTIYPVKIPRVARRWRYQPGVKRGWYAPETPIATQLAEPPIVVRPAADL